MAVECSKKKKYCVILSYLNVKKTKKKTKNEKGHEFYFQHQMPVHQKFQICNFVMLLPDHGIWWKENEISLQNVMTLCGQIMQSFRHYIFLENVFVFNRLACGRLWVPCFCCCRFVSARCKMVFCLLDKNDISLTGQLCTVCALKVMECDCPRNKSSWYED